MLSMRHTHERESACVLSQIIPHFKLSPFYDLCNNSALAKTHLLQPFLQLRTSGGPGLQAAAWRKGKSEAQGCAVVETPQHHLCELSLLAAHISCVQANYH